MAPRRQNYTRSRSTSYNMPSYPPIPPPPPPPNRDLMSPSSRYQHNLRVIQRHDPSIKTLFDQFPHVCVYHHKGDEWQKKGCEGAMFLYEREQEPKYGFYILNRNNTGDYIQRMTPDDDVEFASAYLIYRAYGKVTSDTIGLWTMVTQDREAMSQVMMRLHSYIKRNLRYPDEYRRGPDSWSTTPAPERTQPISSSLASMDPPPNLAFSALLARLGDSPDSPPNPSPPSRTVSASVPPPTGIPLLDSIFASATTSQPTIQTSHPLSLTGDAHHGLVNGVTSANGPSSRATSCGPTPTQHISRLPEAQSAMSLGGKINGSSVNSESTVSPLPRMPNPGDPSLQAKRWTANVEKASLMESTDYHLNHRGQSSQDEESWEEETGASASVGVTEGGVDALSPPRTNKTRKARKRERERERKRRLKRKAASSSAGAEMPGVEHVEWPLVDDRSLSLDEGDEKSGVGLGDGLLDALAAVSEPEALNGQAPNSVLERSPGSKKRRRDRARDWWKRKHKESPGSVLESGNSVDVAIKVQPEEARTALLETYGHRRRVGDDILDEQALAKELVALIHNDPAFLKELYQLYLKRVEV